MDTICLMRKTDTYEMVVSKEVDGDIALYIGTLSIFDYPDGRFSCQRFTHTDDEEEAHVYKVAEQLIREFYEYRKKNGLQTDSNTSR